MIRIYCIKSSKEANIKNIFKWEIYLNRFFTKKDEYCFLSQEAERDGSWYSDHFFLSVQSRTTACGMVLTTLKAALPHP